MFSIDADFTNGDLEKWITEDVQDWISELSQRLFSVGKDLVDKARAKTKAENGFGNITWNLRSSIGCVLVINHAIAPEHIYFPEIGKGDLGHVTGIAYAREIALLVDDGSVHLVFVAGMEYASIVQTTERDVIDHVIGDNLGDALKPIMQ